MLKAIADEEIDLVTPKTTSTTILQPTYPKDSRRAKYHLTDELLFFSSPTEEATAASPLIPQNTRDTLEDNRVVTGEDNCCCSMM